MGWRPCVNIAALLINSDPDEMAYGRLRVLTPWTLPRTLLVRLAKASASSRWTLCAGWGCWDPGDKHRVFWQTERRVCESDGGPAAERFRFLDMAGEHAPGRRKVHRNLLDALWSGNRLDHIADRGARKKALAHLC